MDIGLNLKQIRALIGSVLRARQQLHAPQKVELDVALKLICKDPIIGEEKVGDLLGGICL